MNLLYFPFDHWKLSNCSTNFVQMSETGRYQKYRKYVYHWLESLDDKSIELCTSVWLSVCLSIDILPIEMDKDSKFGNLKVLVY